MKIGLKIIEALLLKVFGLLNKSGALLWEIY
jgi:hypothetical protein